MKLQYLGTAAAEGWPAVFCNCRACKEARKLGGRNIRTRSQAIVDDELLINLPCDTYMHGLREGLDLSAVRWLLVTHSHSDHFAPLELINRGGGYAHDMTSEVLDIYCNEAVEAYFYKAVSQELEPEIASGLRFHILKVFVPEKVGPYTVTPLPARHLPTEHAFIYLIERDGRSLLYAHDTGRLFSEVYDFLRQREKPIDVISLDCTGGYRENGENNGHMGMPDTVVVKNRLLEIGAADEHTRFILNHFSHNGMLLHEELVQQAASEHMEPSYDGMVVCF